MANISMQDMFDQWETSATKLTEVVQRLNEQLAVLDSGAVAELQSILTKLNGTLSTADAAGLVELQSILAKLGTVLNVKATDTDAELALVKAELQAIKTRLNQALDVSVTGSYVRQSTAPRPAGKEGDRLYCYDTRQVFLHDGTVWREV